MDNPSIFFKKNDVFEFKFGFFVFDVVIKVQKYPSRP